MRIQLANGRQVALSAGPARTLRFLVDVLGWRPRTEYLDRDVFAGRDRCETDHRRNLIKLITAGIVNRHLRGKLAFLWLGDAAAEALRQWKEKHP